MQAQAWTFAKSFWCSTEEIKGLQWRVKHEPELFLLVNMQTQTRGNQEQARSANLVVHMPSA